MSYGKSAYSPKAKKAPAKKKATPKKKPKPRPAISAPMSNKRAQEAIEALKLQKKNKK